MNASWENPKIQYPREDKLALTSLAGRAWFTSAMERSEIIHRKGARWAVVEAHPYESWTLFTLCEILMVSTPQPKIEATPMKDQMQYIVIEGRKPQDGAKPAQALLILPKWISPTLACAGIVGRVIELTDGNVIEQGAVPMGEREMLYNLREDAHSDAESQQDLAASIGDIPVATGVGLDRVIEQRQQADEFHYSQQWELLNSLTEAFGRPAGSACLEWLRVELTDLERGRTTPPQAAADVAQQRDDAYREGHQAMRDSVTNVMRGLGMPEGAKPGQWMKEQLEELERHRNAPLPAKLNALLLEFGGTPGGEGYDFLRGELEELAQFRKARDTLDDVRILQDTIDQLEEQVERQAKHLHKIAKHAKKALQ